MVDQQAADRLNSMRALKKANATSSNETIVQAPYFSLTESLGQPKHSVKNSAPSRNV